MVKALSIEEKYVIKNKENKFLTKHDFFDEDISRAQLYSVAGANKSKGYHKGIDWEIVKVKVIIEEV